MKLEKKLSICWRITVLIIGITFILLSIFLSIFARPFFEKKVQKNLILAPNSSRLDLWIKPPVEIYRKFYFFNVENPDEVINGEKPVLTEKGPYVYREVFEKRYVEFLNSTYVSYKPVYSFYFEQNKSNGTDSDFLNILDIPLISVISKAAKVGKLSSLSYFLGDEKLFITRSVHDFLFGYQSSALELVNSATGMSLDEEFGILKKKHAIESEEFIIDSGLDSFAQTGRIIEWNGKNKLDFWFSEKANEIKGSDGTINPTFIKRDQKISTFNSDLCRSYQMKYARDGRVKGVQTFDFTLPDDIFYNSTLNPDNVGFCEGNCLGNGVFNVSRCKEGAPLFLSLPHFLNADKKFVDDVVGLSPKRDTHEFVLNYEPITGSTIGGNARVQINAFIDNSELIRRNDIGALGNTASVLLPVLWFEKTIEIDEKATIKLKKLGFVYKSINIIPLVLMIIGILVKLLGAYLLIKIWSQKKKSYFARLPYQNSPIYNHETTHLNRNNIDM